MGQGQEPPAQGRLTTPDVIVVGAGALGAASAAALRARGARVLLLDPAPEASASAVAAGMLAPALESVLDGADAVRAALLRRARDLWPVFAERHGVALVRDGAAWRGAAPERVHDALVRLGFKAERDASGVFTPDDWRLDAASALAALSAAAGGVRREAAVAVEPGAVTLASGERLTAGHVLVASGAAPLAGVPQPEPIRGQLALYAGPSPPHTLRTDGAYVVPTKGGFIVGATMEPGRTDRSPEPDAAAALAEAAAVAWPAVREAKLLDLRVGVRGATPDGLPLVGPIRPGLSVALAPRRNGWLLAPLVASVAAAYAAGEHPGPDAAALDPLRFQRS